MKIVFMGTPDFAKESLKAIYESKNKYEILGVVTNPDKPKGRGMKMIASPVKEFAQEKELKIYQPTKVKGNTEFINEIKSLNPDVICVVAYGKILPKEILEIPNLGCINVHASLLPKYRGAAPIQWAILNGDKETGITTMYMDEGMDTGDMILKEKVEIGEDETTGELWEKLSKIGGNLLVRTLEQIEDGTAPREKQGEDFTLAPMLDKQMAEINWENQTAEQIHNLVRGLNPIMGAYTIVNNKKIKLWKVKAIKEQDTEKIEELKQKMQQENIDINNITNKKAGEILLADSKKGFYIKAKDGIIEAIEVQGENAKRMSAHDFLLGNKIEY